MPPVLRKNFQRRSGERSGKPRSFDLRLSGLTVAVLLLLFAAVLGWSFFMGFMVGRGQSPEHRVEELTGILPLQEDRPEDEVAQQAAPLADDSGLSESAPSQALQASKTDGPPVADASPDAVIGQPAAAPPAVSPQPAGQDLPFARPSGESLAAWGITPASGQGTRKEGHNPPRKELAPSNSRQEAARQAKPGPARQEARFDYVFQTAAFRSKAEAEALRQQLEAAGMRARVQTGGKLWLVMVHLRGSQREANNIVEELRRMKLGTPLQRSKQAVPSPRGATAR